LLFFISIAFLVSVTVLAIASGPTDLAPASAETWHGLYTDATSYAPGDVIQVYASSPTTETVFRLVRLDTNWTEITRTNPITVGPQTSKVGSFIEYPGVSLSGRISFTLEGWLHPTLLGGDLVVVAGQNRPDGSRCRHRHQPQRATGRVCERYAPNRPDKTRRCPGPGRLR